MSNNPLSIIELMEKEYDFLLKGMIRRVKDVLIIYLRLKEIIL